MTKSEDILKEFNKVLQTLNTFNIEIQLDLINKIEDQLRQHKNSIDGRQSDCNSCQVFVIGSDESVAKTDDNINDNDISHELSDNFDINSHLRQNIRKSKRIHNYMNKRFETTLPEEDNHKTLSERTTTIDINSKVAKIGSSDGQTKSLTTDSVNCDVISEGKPEEDNKKVVTKRKWRKTKDINDLKCKHCGKIWRSLSHLEIHLRSHTGEKVFECQRCGQRFAQSAGLQVHLRRHNNDRRFKCEICEKGFFTKIDLNRHLSSHQEIRQITQCCEICGKGFADKRKVKNHIRYVHEKNDSVVCEICGHRTHGQHLLYAHKRAKHGQSTKYACPVCEAVIGSRSAFIVHMRAHADVKPCACDICGKEFRSKSQVARHKLSHMEGRHGCDICGKKFKTPHHLLRHRIIHSGNKPFGCQLCQYKCNVNSNVAKHMKAVHGLVDFSLKPLKTSVEPIEDEAIQKGSLVTEQVLKDIALTKGKKLSLKQLKLLDENKKHEKEMKTINQRKQSMKTKAISDRNDILDNAITSTFSDNTKDFNGNAINVSFGLNSVPNVSDVYVSEGVSNSVNIYEMTSDANHHFKLNSGSDVGEEQKHMKNIIAFHFAN